MWADSTAADTEERGCEDSNVVLAVTAATAAMAVVLLAEGGGVRTATLVNVLLAFNEGGVCCNA